MHEQPAPIRREAQRDRIDSSGCSTHSRCLSLALRPGRRRKMWVSFLTVHLSPTSRSATNQPVGPSFRMRRQRRERDRQRAGPSTIRLRARRAPASLPPVSPAPARVSASALRQRHHLNPHLVVRLNVGKTLVVQPRHRPASRNCHQRTPPPSSPSHRIPSSKKETIDLSPVRRPHRKTFL